MGIPHEIVQGVGSIAPLSQQALRLIQLTASPQYRLQDVVAIVESDAVLTGNLLRIVNSAAFARRAPIESVARAVPLLGERVMVGVALGLCAAHVLGEELEGYQSERGALWEHALRCGIASRELAAFAGAEVSPEVAYTAGILHDVGKVVISAYLKGRTGEAIEHAETFEVADYLAAERKLLGTDHCEVGAALAERWGLPDSLQQVLRHHHHPPAAPAGLCKLVYTVHLGDFAAMIAGTGTGADTLLYRLDPNYREHVKIGPKQFDQLLVRTDAEYSRVRGLTFPEKERQ